MSNNNLKRQQAIEFLLWLVSAGIFWGIVELSIIYHFWKVLITVIGITIIAALMVIRNNRIK